MAEVVHGVVELPGGRLHEIFPAAPPVVVAPIAEHRRMALRLRTRLALSLSLTSNRWCRPHEAAATCGEVGRGEHFSLRSGVAAC